MSADKKYPRLSISVCATPDATGVTPKKSEGLLDATGGLVHYREPLGEEDFTKLLGWEEETEDKPFRDGEWHLKDRYGKKIRLNNNPHNRPFYPSVAEALAQEHLNNRWQFQSETVGIGEYGNVVDGQHTLVSGKLACQDVQRDPEKWKHNWPAGTVTMQKIVVYGVSESDEVVNTINTGKSRSLTDVLYRTDLFKRMSKSRRQLASKILDYAVRRLWVRTGVCRSAEAPRRTHSEAIDFVERHKRLLDAVKFFMGAEPRKGPKPKATAAEAEEEKTAQVKDYVPLGYAAATLYLMMCSNTPLDGYYRDDGIRNERRLNFSMKELAEKFWTDLPTSQELAPLREAIAELRSTGGGWGRLDEIDCMVLQAWQAYRLDQPVTAATVEIKYTRPDARRRVYPKNPPSVRTETEKGFLGIDLGADARIPAKDADEAEKVSVKKEKAKVDAEKNGSNHKDEIPPEDRVILDHPECDVFLYKAVIGGTWYARDGYADLVGGVIKKKSLADTDGVLRVDIRSNEIEDAVKQLAEAGYTVARCQKGSGGGWVTEVTRAKDAAYAAQD